MNNGLNATVDLTGSLGAVLIRADGSHRDCGKISDGLRIPFLGRPIQWWRSLWAKLSAAGIVTIGFAAFLRQYGMVGDSSGFASLMSDRRVLDIVLGVPVLGLVTQAGANYLAQDFNNAASGADVSLFNYHDSGTGTVSATSTDSALGTQAGPSTRATGTQSNPATNQYRSVGTISYSGTLAITEWGLFNQSAQGGTLWDRRVFAAINVGNGDSIQFTYTLTLSGGGS
jgi:hypothetical protein